MTIILQCPQITGMFSKATKQQQLASPLGCCRSQAADSTTAAVTTHRLQNVLRQILTATEYSQTSDTFFLFNELVLYCLSSSTAAIPA